jgi:thiol-disulfide isomerase/thioredoxin
MERKWLPVSAVALVSMLAGVFVFQLLLSSSTENSSPPAPPQMALQAIPLEGLQGQESLLGDWQGDFLVVNLWAPWCVPCRREVPALIEFQKAYADRGVKVLGIAFDGKDQVQQFAEEYQINYPLFLAGNRISMYNAAFGNPSGALPFTALLDRNLKILFQHNGEVSLEQLRQQLEQAL